MLLVFPLVWALVGAGVDLNLESETSGFATTGRYAEVERVCAALQKAHPRHARCSTFGKTALGRDLRVLVVSRTGALDASTARRRGLPVVLLQGGIHAGEVAGKDAGLMVVRDMLDNKVGQGLLDKVVVVLVPVFNVDGHERFGPNQRPNQNGPTQTGWRVTAQNLNLNRDYMKADTPEMQAMLRLVDGWDPLVTLDMHVTDGADFQLHGGVMVEPVFSGAAVLRPLGRQLRDGVLAHLADKGYKLTEFYPAFQIEDDPQSGFANGVAPPRFSTSYLAQRNRFCVLLETHSYKSFETRVRISVETVLATLRAVTANAQVWQQAAAQADHSAITLGGQRVAVTYADGEQVRQIDFAGYAYALLPSVVSGRTRIAYDPATPQVWNVPYRPVPRADVFVDVPVGGYLVPALHADWVAARLAAHGVAFQRLKSALPDSGVQVFHVETKAFRPEPYEGRMPVKVTGVWRTEEHALPAGALYVPVAQRLSRLVVHLMEPVAPDSLVSWGFFNAYLEQKEYMEPYVLDPEAERMMAQDPVLARDFAERLATDPAFAADPNARRMYFYRRHPSFDSQMDVYPVFRVEGPPSGS